MAELQLTQSLSIRPSHWSGPGNTDYSEPMPDEAEKMDEKFDEKPNLNLVYFAPGDPENPYNWSMGRKTFISFVGILTVSNSTFASSLPSGAITFIREDFGISSSVVSSLTISLYLIGYVVGPIFFAPVSEFYGRKWVSVVAFSWFTLMSIGCALAPNLGALLAFRFLSGIGASAPLSVVGGQLADIWNDPVQRGRAMALFCAFTMVGPTFAPFITGYISASPAGWRMAFWLGVMVAGASFIPLLFFCPETYGPILLVRKAQNMRKAGNKDAIAPLELDERSLLSIFATTLTRPFRMFWQESIVFLTSMFLALLYGTFYLFFTSYPIIFQGIYGFAPGDAGLAFLPLIVGAGLACTVAMGWDQYINRLARADPTRVISPEYRRLPIACFGGLIYCSSLFWQAWTARSDIHWIVPMLAGVPFGFGFCIIFTAFLNYLTDAYEIYAASAMAATSMCRSMVGAAFPLFAGKMYNKLGIPWASSLLGFAAVLMSIIPYLFILYGQKIRDNSKFCQFLLERKQQQQQEEDARAEYAKSDQGV
ncbi:major facilitator superfamily domain-containing protein [Morchella snyderi]|nr:major facilitator superfamily domain-containing protein [Morchella snyderi]